MSRDIFSPHLVSPFDRTKTINHSAFLQDEPLCPHDTADTKRSLKSSKTSEEMNIMEHSLLGLVLIGVKHSLGETFHWSQTKRKDFPLEENIFILVSCCLHRHSIIWHFPILSSFYPKGMEWFREKNTSRTIYLMRSSKNLTFEMIITDPCCPFPIILRCQPREKPKGASPRQTIEK